ncbi:MAG: hypothetical protein Q9P01_18270 [Anaerolineae bacterium]|nr:hypothetical protein [Anaerolineae bacterium]
MLKRIRLKRLLILVAVLALLLASFSAVMAQEETGSEGTDTEQVVEEEAGGGPLDALGINLGFLIAQILNFGLIAFALTAMLWNPARNMLDTRAQKIQKRLRRCGGGGQSASKCRSRSG